jgi:Flp pilus assembly pilin Flp
MTRRNPLTRPVARDSGATSAEYAILVSLIAGVIFAAVMTLGTQTFVLFTSLDWPRP